MLKYFATNRAVDHLGRAIPSGQSAIRHKLSKGGYYFVDMEEYMRFYLGTTDAAGMPPGAIVQDSGTEVFDDFLADRRIGSIVVCVHGFNVELHEAFTWFRILTETMKHIPHVGNSVVTSPADLVNNDDVPTGSLTAFVGFSWPSNGRVLSYLSDQRDAVDSKAAFGSLLARLKSIPASPADAAAGIGKSLNLICHSMGNFLACHTLAALVDKHIVPPDAVGNTTILDLFERGTEMDPTSGEVCRNAWLIDNYVMIAPDVERRHVTKCDGGNVETDYVGPFYSGLRHLVRHKVNIYSRFDGVLAISDMEKVPRDIGLAIGDAASKLTFGLLDFLQRNPDQRWEKRLGEAPVPVNAAPGFTSVNATELTNRKIGHSDHIDARAVVERIAKELAIGEQ